LGTSPFEEHLEKQQSVAKSSVEAEFRAMAQGISEGL